MYCPNNRGSSRHELLLTYLKFFSCLTNNFIGVKPQVLLFYIFYQSVTWLEPLFFPSFPGHLILATLVLSYKSQLMDFALLMTLRKCLSPDPKRGTHFTSSFFFFSFVLSLI